MSQLVVPECADCEASRHPGNRLLLDCGVLSHRSPVDCTGRSELLVRPLPRMRLLFKGLGSSAILDTGSLSFLIVDTRKLRNA